MIKKMILLFNTVKYLKPTQIWHQMWHRVAKKDRKTILLKCQTKCPDYVSQEFAIFLEGLDDSVEYRNRYNLAELFDNEIELLYEKHKIDWTKWHVEEASHLWNYNLHYLEFMVPLALKYVETEDEKYYELWKRIWLSWKNACATDAYEPYTISLRIRNVLVCREVLRKRLERDEGFEKQILNQLYQEYCFLIKNQEVWLLGNHYWENLVTIVLCSLLFAEEKVFSRYFNRLKGQIKEQILEDGVHYERSMMYHKLLLEDCMRLLMGCSSCGRIHESEMLRIVVQAMLDAGYSIENGMGHTPLFNDAGDNVAKPLGDLIATCKNIWGITPCSKKMFEQAGYYRVDRGDIALLFDCGAFGPRYMLGHAHCDMLSFELAVSGKPLFVNAGTGQYQGKYRPFFRSTEAHNTIMIAERQQAELWGEHRAARRGKRVVCSCSECGIMGEFRSFSGDLFKREIVWKSQSNLLIRDFVWNVSKVKEKIKVRAFYRLAPGFFYKQSDAMDNEHIEIYDVDNQHWATLSLSPQCEVVIHRDGEICLYAGEFGKYDKSEVLEICGEITDEVEMHVEINFL